MTGKLFLADGDNYGFYPRRAKAVAEVIDYVRKNGVRISGDAVPDEVGAESMIELEIVTGSTRSVEYVPTSTTTKTACLDELANLIANDPEIAYAARLEGDVAVVPVRGVTVTGGTISYTAPPPPDGQTDDILKPGESSEKLSSSYGADFWIKRNKRGNWQVWFNVDGDPEADVKLGLVKFLADRAVDPDYRADVRTAARFLGWQ
jgi:hypothetical protein